MIPKVKMSDLTTYRRLEKPKKSTDFSAVLHDEMIKKGVNIKEVIKNEKQ